MNKLYLTQKEFTTKYPDTKEFFKRQDRLDTKFYPFYGIEKSIIKIEDGRYQIPLESAPILALMIRAYANACGIDRRVANKKTGVLYSCEMYHEFIDTLQKGLDELPIYQKAFIQRYSSYTSAVIIDSFLPLLIERLTLLIVAFFKFSHSKNIDFISILLRSIDLQLEEMAKIDTEPPHNYEHPLILKFLEQESQAGAKLGEPTGDSGFSFEKALGDSFRFFSEPDYQPTPKVFSDPSYAEELWRKKQAAKKNQEISLSEQFSNVYDEKRERYEENDEIFRRNIKAEMDFFNAFYTAKTNEELFYLNIFDYPADLAQAFKVILPKISLTKLEGDGIPPTFEQVIQRMHDDAASLSLQKQRKVETDIDLLRRHKKELIEYFTLESPKSIEDFINECQERRWENKDKFAEKFSDECKEGSKDRIAICNFYEWAQKSPLYEEVQERLKAVVSMLLPIKFAQTDRSNSKTISSQK